MPDPKENQGGQEENPNEDYNLIENSSEEDSNQQNNQDQGEDNSKEEESNNQDQDEGSKNKDENEGKEENKEQPGLENKQEDITEDLSGQEWAAKEAKIDSFLNSEDGKIFKDLAPKIKEVAKLGLRTSDNQPLSIEAIVSAAVGFRTALKLGAQMRQEADNEAAGDRTGGGSPQQGGPKEGGSIPDPSGMSNSEFLEAVNKMRMG